MTTHDLPAAPHWSEAIDWRPGRWDPLSNAPLYGRPALLVRARDAKGHTYDNASGGASGEGWGRERGATFKKINAHITSWQPMRAAPRDANGEWDE